MLQVFGSRGVRMGIFGNLFRTKADPLSEMRQKVADNPRDARLAMDLATQLKAKGQHDEAIEYARRSAQAHREAGFVQKSVAVLKSALSWGVPTSELLEDLAATYLELKLKEDAREMLVKLRSLHREAGQHEAVAHVGARIAELGPGR